jgi:thiamine pyrophosphate-dependent acetolactate synthase large subunit-like protein
LVPQPDPQELTQAAFLLRLSARPVILAGGGVAIAGAGDELARIAEKLDAPVVTTWNGKGTIPDGNPFSAGALFGTPEAGALLESADTVFALGTTFDAGPELNLPAQMVQVDSDPEQIGKKYPLRLGIAGDAKAALAGILTALESPNPLKGVADRTSIAEGDRTGPARAAQLREAAFGRARDEAPERMEALEAIRGALPDDTTILHRHPGSAEWFYPFFQVPEVGGWLVPNDSSFPVAEAAAAAGGSPGPLVTFCEEDELIPHLQELEGLEEPGDLIFVVFTDRSDQEKESALARAANAAGLSVVVTSGAGELAGALKKAVGSASHSILESDLGWAPPA